MLAFEGEIGTHLGMDLYISLVGLVLATRLQGFFHEVVNYLVTKRILVNN